jgi:hypothetical protein
MKTPQTPLQIKSHPWTVAARVLVAIVLGYALANSTAILLTYILPIPRSDAVMTSLLVSFAIYAAAVLWVFSVRSLHSAWIGLALPTLILAAISAILKYSGVAP